MFSPKPTCVHTIYDLLGIICWVGSCVTSGLPPGALSFSSPLFPDSPLFPTVPSAAAFLFIPKYTACWLWMQPCILPLPPDLLSRQHSLIRCSHSLNFTCWQSVHESETSFVKFDKRITLWCATDKLYRGQNYLRSWQWRSCLLLESKFQKHVFSRLDSLPSNLCSRTAETLPLMF